MIVMVLGTQCEAQIVVPHSTSVPTIDAQVNEGTEWDTAHCTDIILMNTYDDTGVDFQNKWTEIFSLVGT